VKIFAGGRTDAGVHAMGQVVNFSTDKEMELMSLVKGLNAVLPRDIRVRDAGEVPQSFHARYSAKSKTYVYCILNDVCNSPFLARYVLHVPYALDLSCMEQAIKTIVGEHDFSAFKKKDEFYKNPVREVKRAGIVTKGRIVYIIIEATGFLRYMVRNIAGTLLLAGQGKISRDGFGAVLESRERERAGPTAAPHGLFLKKIKY
jgi:tRNA pseudouridine38-40 synthase